MITACEVKSVLVEYMDTEREIDNEIERFESLEAKMYEIGSPEITDMPRNPSPSNDRMAVLIQKKADLEEKIRRLIHDQGIKRKSIEDTINKMNHPDQRAVIRMRYLDRESWNSVSKMMFGESENFEEKQDSYMKRVMILHGNALQQMADVMNQKG